MPTVSRVVDYSYPVGDAPEVLVSNRYGQVNITSWQNDVVRITAKITAGSDDPEVAKQYVQRIEVRVEHHGDRVSATTAYPRVPEGVLIGYAVDYEVHVPKEARLVVDNLFGDTSIADLSGPITLDSRYGVVVLSDLSGTLRVRAKGDFPLEVRRVSGDNVFVLRSSKALFSDVAGNIKISNYLGSTELREPAESLSLSLTAESGPIHLYIPIGEGSYLHATTQYGAIETDFPAHIERRGQIQRLVYGDPASARYLEVHATFDSIRIHEVKPPAVAQQDPPGSTQPLMSVTTQSYAVEQDTQLIVEAIAGNVKIEGADTSEVVITATRRVRVESIENSQLALEGLGLRIEEDGGILRLRSVIQDDLDALGCTSYGLDLTISCPRTLRLHLRAEDGITQISGTGGEIVVEQKRGTVAIEHAKGAINVSNEDGAIEIKHCAGPVQATAVGGNLRVQDVYGLVVLTSVGGDTLVQSVHAGLKIRNRNGDVRIMALEGIHGDYDIAVEDGNLSIAVPDSADATLWLSAYGGSVRSAIPVTGTMERTRQTFQGRLNKGTYRVHLEARNGNIVVD